MKNELKTGVIISYFNLAISMIIPFIYTPIMLRILGQAEYGLYSLSSSAVAYLSLLSFGFGSTIIRYIAKYRAENNKEQIERTYGFFILLYFFLAIVVLGVGLIIANNVEPIFHRGLNNAELTKMKILVIIMAFNSALAFPNSVFSSMIGAYEKYIFKKLVDVIATVVAPLGNLIALYLGFQSVGMAVVSTIIQSIMLPLNIWYCYKKLKLKPKFTILPKTLIKEMLGFSAFVFIGSIVDMLFWSTDKVILGMLASSSAVAIFNVGCTFNSMVMNLSTSITGVLAPRITGMIVKDASSDQLTNLFIRIGRLQFIIIGLLVSGFIVFGQVFIDLWAGHSYAEAYWVALLNLVPLSIPLIQNTGLNIIIAQNKHQFRSVVYLIIAIINVISTYLIVPTAGILGAAYCSCISYIVGQGLIMNIYYYKVTKIDIPLFWKNIGKLLWIPVGLTILGIVLQTWLEINNVLSFVICGSIYVMLYGILMIKFGFNEYEKEIFLKPVFKLLKR